MKRQWLAIVWLCLVIVGTIGVTIAQDIHLGNRITKIETKVQRITQVIQKRELLLAPCVPASPKACQALLKRLIANATPAQLAHLRARIISPKTFRHLLHVAGLSPIRHPRHHARHHIHARHIRHHHHRKKGVSPGSGNPGHG